MYSELIRLLVGTFPEARDMYTCLHGFLILRHISLPNIVYRVSFHSAKNDGCIEHPSVFQEP
jgi:hypothetical protein